MKLRSRSNYHQSYKRTFILICQASIIFPIKRKTDHILYFIVNQKCYYFLSSVFTLCSLSSCL